MNSDRKETEGTEEGFSEFGTPEGLPSSIHGAEALSMYAETTQEEDDDNEESSNSNETGTTQSILLHAAEQVYNERARYDALAEENEYLKALVLETHGNHQNALKNLVRQAEDAEDDEEEDDIEDWTYDGSELDDDGSDSIEIVRGQPTNPPKGPIVCMLFTDIEKSTMMQKTFLDKYDDLQDIHDKACEDAIYEFNGYVVNKVGDLYFAVFPSAAECIQAACKLQTNLYDAPWPEYFAETKFVKPFAGTPDNLFKGIRVRVGVHCAELNASHNPFDNAPEQFISKANIVLSVDYQGNAVSLSERVMEFGQGGQVLISGAAYKAAEEFFKKEGEKYHVIDHGNHVMKGLREIHIYGIQSLELKGREFPALGEKHKEKNKRIQTITDMLEAVEGILSHLKKSRKDENHQKNIREAGLKVNDIIAECRELKKEIRLKGKTKRSRRSTMQRGASNNGPRTRNRFKAAKKLGPRELGTFDNDGWSAPSYNVVQDGKDFLAERLGNFHKQQEKTSIHKAGPREIGVITDWKPAEYDVNINWHEDFLRERTSSRKHRPRARASKKLGPREIGQITDWKPAEYNIESNNENFLKERTSTSARKSDSSRPSAPIEKKLGPREIGTVNSDWKPAMYKIDEDKSDYLKERVSTVKVKDIIKVQKKAGPREIGKVTDWQPAKYDIDHDNGDFLAEKVSKTGPTKQRPRANTIATTTQTANRRRNTMDGAGVRIDPDLMGGKKKRHSSISVSAPIGEARKMEKTTSDPVTTKKNPAASKAAQNKFMKKFGMRSFRKSSSTNRGCSTARGSGGAHIRANSLNSESTLMKSKSLRRVNSNTGKSSDPLPRKGSSLATSFKKRSTTNNKQGFDPKDPHRFPTGSKASQKGFDEGDVYE